MAKLTDPFIRLSFAAAGLLSAGLLSSCDGDKSTGPMASPTTAPASNVSVVAQKAGPTPFIAFVELGGTGIATLSDVRYEIQARPGTASQSVNVSYTIASLRSRGRVNASGITLPVFGLYANYANTASITLTFNDGSSQVLLVSITTPDYQTSPFSDAPRITKARTPNEVLGFDFYAVKPSTTNGSSLLVYDSDGYIRWASTTAMRAGALFRENGFDLASAVGPVLYREELDGTTTSITPAPSVTLYHHNFEQGPKGILTMPDFATRTEDVLTEVAPNGETIKTWDMVQIFSDYMSSKGDDPSAFVRPGLDWFHMNSVVFDASDNSLIVSSRENFVVKIGYDTGDIKWILGDPSKYWFTFLSLREKALSLTPNALVPSGQHSLSILPDGQLLMFNNGAGSFNNPIGTPAGVTRAYASVSAFKIDPTRMSATPGLTFDDNQTVSSPICSSVYLAPDGSMLLTYSQADNSTALRIKGLNPALQTVFDISFATQLGCQRGWNAIIVPFHNIKFTS